MGRKKVEVNPESGKRLSELLNDRNMQQKELAEALHYTPQQISRIITGKDRLTEEFAHKVIELFKTGDLETDLFDTVRYEWLMCYDDFKTAGQRLNAINDTKDDVQNSIAQIIELLGYRLEYVRILCLADGDKVKPYPPGITLNEAFDYEQKRGHISKEVKFEDFIKKTGQDKGKYFFFKPMITMKSPKGSTRYMEQTNFTDILNDISEFIDYKCAIQFKRLVDKAKNLYI